jgi:hypothetical protein
MRRKIAVGEYVGYEDAWYRFVHLVTEVGENHCRLAVTPQVRYHLPFYIVLPSFGGLVTVNLPEDGDVLA